MTTMGSDDIGQTDVRPGGTVVGHLLYETGGNDVARVRQLVFGNLLVTATPVVTAYHSDFYHDALWLHEHLSGEEVCFYFSFNATGTSIGHGAVNLREYAYRVVVRVDEGRYTMRVQRLGGDGA